MISTLWLESEAFFVNQSIEQIPTYTLFESAELFIHCYEELAKMDIYASHAL